MSSDDIKRPKDTAFRYAGEGLPIWPLCFFFHQRKERSGGKMRGPLRNLFSCKACEEKRK
ncbi:MAG TPA: hypothetical protein PK365_12280 [Nitrospira sp.]|mgnify:CR=1 FL=1|nr:hypothetical protein [Nitrospira sp.]HNG01999.1 hypothetical protein [Nitrospira sp.]HNI18244.1 hypothetical protein [Nitrospira sp.]